MTPKGSFFVEFLLAGVCLGQTPPGFVPSDKPGSSAYVAPMPTPWEDPGFMQAIWVQSPNNNKRPSGVVVDTVVVHSTVIESLKQTVFAFCREASQVSAHYVIGKDGSIVQCVSTFRRAWHAGVSRDV